MKIIVSESQLKRIVDENVSSSPEPVKPLSVVKTQDNNLLINNKYTYRLKAKLLGLWKDVTINEIRREGDTFKLSGQVGPYKDTDVVSQNTVKYIIQNLGQKEIELRNDENKVTKKLELVKVS